LLEKYDSSRSICIPSWNDYLFKIAATFCYVALKQKQDGWISCITPLALPLFAMDIRPSRKVETLCGNKKNRLAGFKGETVIERIRWDNVCRTKLFHAAMNCR